jgi:hypothetical protein
MAHILARSQLRTNAGGYAFGRVMESSVIRRDIEHYREMLKIIPDPAERWQIEKLLLVLEAKLEKHNECHEKK